MKVACLQMEPRIGQVQANVARSLEMIAQAAQAMVRLTVLPELCNTGYVFETREEALALSEEVPDGPTCEMWMAAAHTHSMFIVAGITERENGKLYNSAVLIGPEGHIGTYRKNHLWGAENTIFEPGNLGVPVFDIGVGRVACAICYDIWFPEIFRLAALQGADLLCVATNWVPMPEQPGNVPMMANILAMGGAHANSIVCGGRRSHRRQARPAVPRQQCDRQPYRLAARGTGEPGSGRDARRRYRPCGCAAQSTPDRVQRAAAGSPHGSVWRNARLRGNPRLLIAASANLPESTG